MRQDRWWQRRRLAATITIVGNVQFLIGTAVAMALYAGGTAWAREASGYSFWTNFFSDLGLWRSWSGRSNEASSVLFGVTTALFGLSLLPLYGMIGCLLPGQRIVSRVVQVTGTLSAIGIVGASITPYDHFNTAHTVAVGGWLAFFLIAASAFALGSARSAARSKADVIFSLVVAVLFGIQLFQGIVLPDSPAMPATQKIIVYSHIAWSIYCARQMARPAIDISTSR